MTSTSDDRGGSFKALRDLHLPMFDETLHRHERGWPHPPPVKGEAQSCRSPDQVKRVWKTKGIFHFTCRDQEDAAAD